MAILRVTSSFLPKYEHSIPVIYFTWITKLKKCFQPGPMFRSPGNLNSYLVRAKMYPLERKTKPCKCKGSRYQVCLNVSETKTFTSTLTHMSYKINHRFDCNEKCLIYLLTCKNCLKQYVGSSTDCFRYHWNNYKCNDRKYVRGKACLQEHLFEYFKSKGQNNFLHDVSVTLIDKTDAKNPIKREHCWRHTLKTLAPHGLHVDC